MSKREQALEMYKAALPRREDIGKGWRVVILHEMMAALDCTLAAAVSHFNNARIALGGEVKTRDKPNVRDTAERSAATPPTAIEQEVWAVESTVRTLWYLGEAQARAAAERIPNVVRVYRDTELE